MSKNNKNPNLKNQFKQSKRKLQFQSSNQSNQNDSHLQRKILKSLDKNKRSRVQNEFLKNLNQLNLDKLKRLLNQRNHLIINNQRSKNDLHQVIQSNQVQVEVRLINLKKIEKKLRLPSAFMFEIQIENERYSQQILLENIIISSLINLSRSRKRSCPLQNILLVRMLSNEKLQKRNLSQF